MAAPMVSMRQLWDLNEPLSTVYGIYMLGVSALAGAAVGRHYLRTVEGASIGLYLAATVILVGAAICDNI